MNVDGVYDFATEGGSVKCWGSIDQLLQSLGGINFNPFSIPMGDQIFDENFFALPPGLSALLKNLQCWSQMSPCRCK